MAENSIVTQLNRNISCLETLIDYQKNEPFFYFKVKLILNRNNSFTLGDKVLAVGRNYLYIFWTQQEASGKFQALNTAKKEGVDFGLIQNPQQKIPLSKFDQFTLIASTDSQFIPYLKSVVPSLSKQQQSSLINSSILFMKSLQDYETHCVICPSYCQGMELLYALETMKSLQEYEQKINDHPENSRNSVLLHKANLKLMQMICNLKFGFLNASPDNFGYNFDGNYSTQEENKEMAIYNQSCLQILKNTQTYQFASNFNIRLPFKIIDEGSKEYASNFLMPNKVKTQRISMKGCQLVQEMFQSLINHMQQQTIKENKFQSNLNVFPNLKYLNLTQNKLTDNIFAVFQRLIFPQSDKNGPKASIPAVSTKNISPLFPCLTILDLSKNYITLQSLQTHKKLVRVLENLSQFVLKISLSHNMIKSLDFFEKYFIKADANAGSISLNPPVQYFDLKNNASLLEQKKQAFINSYIERIEELEEKCITEIGFMVDLGVLLNNGNPNVFRYLSKLRKYLVESETSKDFEQRSEFDMHFRSMIEQVESDEQSEEERANPNAMTFSLSRPSNQVPEPKSLNPSPQRQSQLLPQKQPLLQKTSTQSRDELLTQVAKLFYLRDYKQLGVYKQQLKARHQVSEESLLSTFVKEYEEKRVEQKRILQWFDQVMNFVDFNTNTVKTPAEERLINEKLDRLVGIIRRKGLQGQASSTIVYLKHMRDQMIQRYLESKDGFDRINPIYDVIKKMKDNYQKIYQQAIQQGSSLAETDYKELCALSGDVLEKRFFQNKGSEKMDEALYDRLRYVLVDRKLKLGEIVSMAGTLTKELKLLPVRAVRLYERTIIHKKSNLRPLIHVRQKLTSHKFQVNEIKNKMQYIRQYSISHYPFNSRIKAQTELSGYDQPMTCLSFPEHLLQQALSFISIVNNFITFLYYTPDSISEQTVTYVNYIVTYLNDLALESFQDLQWKEFLIEELYVHFMAFRPENQLAKGLMLSVLEYLTGRILCRPDLEKYILAFLLENEAVSLDDSHLILNSLRKSQGNIPSSAIIQRECKISWTIPNQFLLNSFLNQGRLSIHLKLDTSSLIGQKVYEDQIEIFCHQSRTIGQLLSYVLDQNNGFVTKMILERKLKGIFDSSESEELEKYWLFEKKTTSNKLHYFRPYQSCKYLGQIISESFENNTKAVLYLRKCVMSHHYHNKNYLSYELNQIELYALFNKLVANLQMSLDLISQLPQEMTWLCYYGLPFSGSGSYTPNEFAKIVIAHVICIFYMSEVNRLTNPQSPASQLGQDDFEEKREDILRDIVDIILIGKANENSQPFIVNCKTFSIEDRLQITNKVKQIFEHQNQSQTTLSDQILTFINCLGDLAFYQTLIDGQQIIMMNSRHLIVGKLLEHTNELNQIINVYSKLEYFIPINQIIDVRLVFSDEAALDSVSLSIYMLNFDDMSKSIGKIHRQITGKPFFIICAYNLLVAVCKNIVNFDAKLLYEIQQSGLGTSSKKRNSKILEFYNDHKNIQGLYEIPPNLISFAIIRNKENQNYQKISQNNSKQSLKIEKSEPLIHSVQNQSHQNLKPSPVHEIIDAKESAEEINEVYSRKSSKRSLKSSISEKSMKRSNSRNGTNQNNTQNQDSDSLIPSRKSIIDPGAISPKQNKSSFEKAIPSPISQEIDTYEIISRITQDQRKPQEAFSKSQALIKEPEESGEQVVTNQQRKSKREIPKRRSSRESKK